MARRHFINIYKANGKGQSSGFNTSDLTNSGVGPFSREHDAAKSPSRMVMNKDVSASSSWYVVQPKQTYRCPGPPPSEHASAEGSWNSMKQMDQSRFIDIDGDNFPADEEAVKVKPPPTAHTVQSYLSLVDLTRPYVPKPPTEHINGSNPVHDDLFHAGTAVNQSSRSKTEERSGVLPRGFDRTDQPYVPPKFTPTFREMMSTKLKKDTLVSIMEQTPPSMQKWAIDWNSEPKNSISIAELKEDVFGEKLENNSANDSTNPEIELRSNYTPHQQDDSQQRNDTTVPGHQNSQEFVFTDERTNTMQPTDLEKEQAQKFAQRNIIKPSLDWLPDKYKRLKSVSEGQAQEKKFSFKEVFNEEPVRPKSKESPLQHISIDNNLKFFDDGKHKFREWFQTRLSQANRPSRSSYSPFSGIGDENAPNFDTGSKTNPINHSGEDPTQQSNTNLRHQTYEDQWNSCPLGDRTLNYNTEDSRRKDDIKQRPLTSPNGDEKNSSFYCWLKQRMSVMKTSGKPVAGKTSKPEQRTVTQNKGTDEVQSVHPNFPWSRSYSRYTPKTLTKQKPIRKWEFKRPSGMLDVRSKSRRQLSSKEVGRVSMDKWSDNGSKRIRSGESISSQRIRTQDIINRKVDSKSRDDQRKETYGLVLNNEFDHINKIRNSVDRRAVEVTNTHPSLLSYWESRYSKPLSPTIETEDFDGLFYHQDKSVESQMKIKKALTRGTLYGSVVEDKSTKYVNADNFFHICEEPSDSLKKPIDTNDNAINIRMSNYEYFLRTNEPKSNTERRTSVLDGNIGARLTNSPPIPNLRKTESSSSQEKVSHECSRPPKSAGSVTLSEDDMSLLGKLGDYKSIDLENEAGLSLDEVDKEWISVIGPQNLSDGRDEDLIESLKQNSESRHNFVPPPIP